MPEKTYRHIMKQPRLTFREAWVTINAAEAEMIPALLAISTRDLHRKLKDKAISPALRRRAQHIHQMINDRSLYGITGVPRTPDAEI